MDSLLIVTVRTLAVTKFAWRKGTVSRYLFPVTRYLLPVTRFPFPDLTGAGYREAGNGNRVTGYGYHRWRKLPPR